jgi:hypothetical protein
LRFGHFTGSMSGSRVRWRRAARLTSKTRVAVTQWSLAIARDAYLFTHPLAMRYRTMSMQAIKGDRRFGKWLQLGRSDKESTRLPAPNEAATRGGSSGVDRYRTPIRLIGSGTSRMRRAKVQWPYPPADSAYWITYDMPKVRRRRRSVRMRAPPPGSYQTTLLER